MFNNHNSSTFFLPFSYSRFSGYEYFRETNFTSTLYLLFYLTFSANSGGYLMTASFDKTMKVCEMYHSLKNDEEILNRFPYVVCMAVLFILDLVSSCMVTVKNSRWTRG